MNKAWLEHTLLESVLAHLREGPVRTPSLREVEGALGRLRDGSFGSCRHCQREIAAKRLRAIPWATYCVSCQEKAEAGEITLTGLALAA